MDTYMFTSCSRSLSSFKSNIGHDNFSEKQTGTNSSKQANINTENAIKIKDEWMNVHHDTRRANQIKHLKHFFFVYVFKIVRTIVIRSIDQKNFWHTFITNYDICEFFFLFCRIHWEKSVVCTRQFFWGLHANR